jgi:prepilin-type N-terminal cleavage/methylation domain-containing protein
MSESGFTLIELMMVVCMIGILAAIAQPRLARTIRKAQESSTKANLAALRASITLYYADYGNYPIDDLASLVTGGYLNAIPIERTPPHDDFAGHPGGNVVGAGSIAAWGTNAGNWYYFNVPGETRYGQIVVNCNHPDSNGIPWDTH